MRHRLREYPSDDELAELYGTQYDHRHSPDHLVRVPMTVALGLIWGRPDGTIVDLSCGDGAIPQHLARVTGAGTVILGDYTPGWDLCGPIEQTIEKVEGQADIFVLSETIEHVADPDLVLRAIRLKTRRLLLTTPAGELPGSPNPQHIWGWEPDDIAAMAAAAGFTPLVFNLLDLRMAGFLYAFQMWVFE